MNTTHQRRYPRPNLVRTGALVAGLAIVAVACGSDDDSSTATSEAEAAATAASDEAEAAATESTPAVEATDTATTGDTAPAEAGPVGVASTDLGEILVDADGFALYGFTPDESGSPTCVDDCALAWPPLELDGDSLPAGLDAAVFSVSERPDGSFQLAAGGWPLYRFAADTAPGETTGQGSGDVWFVVAPDGALIGVDGASFSGSGDVPATTLFDDGY